MKRKRNGMCPICYIKQLFTKKQNITDIFRKDKYDNNVALTPPMGWSTWNTFKNTINQDLVLETGTIMRDKGLIDAGYKYINLDDNWHSSLRDCNGDLQGDLTRFSEGIPTLINKLNNLGLKVGLYTSNGTQTCEDLPASLGRERQDAYTFAKWGVEYFKYDFCHNIAYSDYAPLIYSISIAPFGKMQETEYLCEQADVFGLAKRMPDKNVKGNRHISGLDKNSGAMQYNNINVDADGEYVLTINVSKKGEYEKYLMAIINGDDCYEYAIPPQKLWNHTARFQQVVKFKKGANTIRLFNPIGTRADSAMLQYQLMGKCLNNATKKVAEETNQPIKPIVYSICEWGKNEPHKWGATAGNLWRTTGDISPYWASVISIYENTVDLYKYASIGAWNDPDMLEVGNGNLTFDENIAHFSLWCMMNSPLILGNDLRKLNEQILEIITNKNLIAINQDVIGKQAMRVFSKDKSDVLAKPLANGKLAVCLFNKDKITKEISVSIDSLINSNYLSFARKDKYTTTDQWTNEKATVNNLISATLPSHAVKVFILE